MRVEIPWASPAEERRMHGTPAHRRRSQYSTWLPSAAEGELPHSPIPFGAGSPIAVLGFQFPGPVPKFVSVVRLSPFSVRSLLSGWETLLPAAFGSPPGLGW